MRRFFYHKKLLLIFGILTGTILIYFGLLQWKIAQYSQMKAPNHADYLIILGANVKGTVPSSVLQSRIDTAAIYLNNNPKTIAIASGGKGPGEEISEAEAIKKELLKKGISGSRILLESQSTNTYENIKFSKKLLPKNAKTGVVVTNRFHLYRALMIARDQNLNLHGLPASTPLLAIPRSYIREYLAITKYYLLKI
ncbi:MAG: YdcF family protein [Bacillota bacterium]|nr:YdcF family protein [Bacillota bacterium]